MRKFNLLLFCSLFCISIFCTASPQTYGPIKKGELLWNVATKLRSDDSVSQYQIMIALLKANPEAFSIACNINSLKIGVTMRVPSLAEIQALSAEQARKEYQRQDGEWKTYRRNKQKISCSAIESAKPSEVTETTVPTTSEKEVKSPATTLAQSKETTAEKQTETTTTSSSVAAKTVENTVNPAETEKKSAPNVTSTAEETTQKTVVGPQEPSKMASSTAPTVTPPKQAESALSNEISKKDSDSTTENSVQKSFYSADLFSGKIIVAIIMGALLAAFLIGWLLHKIVQRRQSPSVETLENHPLFDSIDKVLLTGQPPKNQ